MVVQRISSLNTSISLSFLLMLAFYVPAAKAQTYADATKAFQQGDYTGALAQFRKLAEKSNSDPRIHYMIGVCCVKLGKTSLAKPELQWVASYSKDPLTKQRAIAMLASISPASSAPPASAPAAPSANAAPPYNLVNNSVSQTVALAAQNGWVPCPGKCLKLATPGWQKKQVEGHPDTDNWFTFKFEGGENAYSQYHIGHIINTFPDKPAEDTGACPICGGTGWVRKK